MYVKILILQLMLMSFFSYAGKKQCQPYLDKLRNIQSMQKVGHSNSKGRSLSQREEKAREVWWQCQQGKLPKAKVKKSNSSKSANSSKRKNTTPAKKSFVVSQKTKQAKTGSTSEFNLTNKLVIKGKFQGEKQQRWLDYYQQPEQCIKPKSTQTFAFCMENRRLQQQAFDKADQQTQRVY